MIIRSALSAAPTAGTPPVAHTITVTGAASTMQPKAALYRASAGTADGTIVNAYRMLLGMTDGTTQRSLGAMAENGQSNSNQDCRTRHDTATVVQAPLGASGAINGEAFWQSWQNGGSRIDWADLLNAASLIAPIYLFGDDVTASVVEFTHTGAKDATQDVPDLGFAPDFAIFYSHWSAYAADTDSANGRVGIGVAVKTFSGGIEQFCYSDHNHDRPALNFAGGSRIDDTVCVYQTDDVTDGSALELTLWNGNTPRFTKRNAAGNISTAILFVKLATQTRLRAVVLPTTDPGGGAPWLDTSTTGNKTISIGFRTEAYQFIGTNLTAKNTTTRANTARSMFSDGIWTGTESNCVGCEASDSDTSGPPKSETRSVTTSKIADVLSIDGARDWEASHVSVGGTGPVINIDTASAAARMAAIFAIGGPVRVIAETEQISDGAVLKIQNILPVGETETILESHALAVTNRLPTSDTEQISDQFSFLQADRRIVSETEQISDVFNRIVGEHRPFNDTEQIDDSPRLVLNRHTDFSETEAISDGTVLALQTPGAFMGNDTEQISDVAQLTLGYFIKTSETEQISDYPAFKLATNITSFGETERISDAVTLRLGRVLVTSDTEQISDGFSSGRGLIARKAIRRGKVF